MKKSVFLFSSKLLGTICIAVLLLAVSCEKKKMRDDLKGTWNVIEYVEDGDSISGYFESGTVTFGDCSRKDNKNYKCIMTHRTVLSSTPEEIVTDEYFYQVGENNKMIIGDSEFEISFDGNKLTLTSNEVGSGLYAFYLEKQ